MNVVSTFSPIENIILRQLGLKPYHLVWQAMISLTEQRHTTTLDEIWLVQHPAIFTQGRSGKTENLLLTSDIPVFQSDRGGKITYHGPGQQVMYLMIDLKRLNISPHQLVKVIEKTVIQTLVYFGIIAYSDSKAPGIYVQGKKICSLGLRIHKGCSLHGFALNVDMDLTPFLSINPCGYANMEMTQVSEWVKKPISLEEIHPILIKKFIQQLGYLNYLQF